MKRHSTWKKLIEDSKVYGMDQIKDSSISQIFYFEESLSMLTFKENRQFIYGAMYNASFIIAAILYYMAKTNFLPHDYKERQEAIKCLGRIMMYLTLYGTPTVMSDSASINNTPQIEFHGMTNFGLFSLAGKLPHACRANTLAVGLNDKVALVALEPIARGTELTISYLDHWLDKGTNDTPLRNRIMFFLCGSVCNCVICSGDWQHRRHTLTPTQRATHNTLNFQEIDFTKLPTIYKNLCKVMAELRDVPFSEEYRRVYRFLRTCLLHSQHVYTKNVVLQCVRAK